MKPKGRPKKYRIIGKDPKITQFSPRGKPGRPDEVVLSMDQFEAVRLIDMHGKSQKDASRLMRISQQTVSRILKGARKALADAVVNGKIIRIHGGYYVVTSRQESLPGLTGISSPKPAKVT
jgi:predicted DNA-binding protein (UPF0251 family)